jgi:excinuclease ABC subunit C
VTLAGLSNLKRFIEQAPRCPGVYKMISQENEIIYIGKAKNIRNRIKSYYQFDALPKRLQLMVSMIEKVKFETTANELEALFLEASLITKHVPRFNVLLKTPKNYNYIAVTKHKYPRIAKFRESESGQDSRRFGPYYSGREAAMVLDFLTSAFKVRTCTDRAFSLRTRPCLKYHIKRCSAPCCSRISEAEYAENVRSIVKFLGGQSFSLRSELSAKMLMASNNFRFEEAAVYRDQIRLLTKIQTVQNICININVSLDVLGLALSAVGCCVQVNAYRHGELSHNEAYFINISENDLTKQYSPAFILAEFIKQYYQSCEAPDLILTSHEPQDLLLLKQFVGQRAGRLVKIQTPKLGSKRSIVMAAVIKAQDSLSNKKPDLKDDAAIADLLSQMLGISDLNRIEIYDNSHIQGTFAYGAMVIYEIGKGFNKSSYRLFKMQEKRGDDCAMMGDMLMRRFSGSLKEEMPSLIILDGGKGQLSAVQTRLKESCSDVKMISIAKGIKRNAGDETIYYEGRALEVSKNSPLMYFLQRLRDEAHRFAISSHRKARGRNAHKSVLDDVPGIGSKRHRDLLAYFGSVENILAASAADLSKVGGIGKELAENIFKYLRKADKD